MNIPNTSFNMIAIAVSISLPLSPYSSPLVRMEINGLSFSKVVAAYQVLVEGSSPRNRAETVRDFLEDYRAACLVSQVALLSTYPKTFSADAQCW